MKKIINSPWAPKAVGPYSQAVMSGNTLYISGQIPVDASIGKVVEGGITEQTHQVLKNIGHVLAEAGLSYKNVLKCTCLLDNMDNFAAMNEVYALYFPENPPARAAYGVVRLPLGVMIEIECIAEV